jgi:hypothetical protein
VTIIRDREDARWLPSRFRFALFRLFALLRMRFTPPRPRPGLIMAVHRDQSEIEAYAVALWIFATVTCFLSALMPIAIAAVFAPLAMQIPLYIVARGTRVNSILLMALIAAAAIYFATRPVWIRFAAWQFLALVALNAVAALIMLALRGAVRKMEARCGL